MEPNGCDTTTSDWLDVGVARQLPFDAQMRWGTETVALAGVKCGGFSGLADTTTRWLKPRIAYSRGHRRYHKG